MNLLKFQTNEDLNEAGAGIVTGLVQTNPRAVLGLATGSTPIGIYEELIRSFRKGLVRFNEVTTFNLDEYVGLPEDHPERYRNFMKRHLFDHIDLPENQAHIPDGNAADLNAECLRYNKLLEANQPLDLQILGLEAFDIITRFHSHQGTTTMLATSVTAGKESIDRLLEAVQEYRDRDMPYAQLAGVHLEGPFISPKFPGAQNPAFIVPPQPDWVESWIADYPGIVKILTFAPETEGAVALAERLTEEGIVASAGHTNATYEEMERAAEHGLCHAVHTFNAMRGLHHREPGTVGAVLTDDRIFAEVIADGHHVHQAGIRLLTRTKAADRLVLITDAMSAAGLGDGEYDLGGLPVHVSGGVARLEDGKTLAGSTLTMMGAFRFMIRDVGVSLPEVSQMASGNPARQLGIADQTGSLAEGKQADFLLVSPDLELQKVWIAGRIIL